MNSILLFDERSTLHPLKIERSVKKEIRFEWNIPSGFCNHPEEEEKSGCFAIIVLQMYCYCKCYVVLPHGAVGWFAVCDGDIS